MNPPLCYLALLLRQVKPCFMKKAHFLLSKSLEVTSWQIISRPRSELAKPFDEQNVKAQQRAPYELQKKNYANPLLPKTKTKRLIF